MSKRCGTKYKHIIGYGPICPSEWLRQQKLRYFPPHCPKCGSTDYRRLSLWCQILDLFNYKPFLQAALKSASGST